ncbi:glycosyltransferase family 2 protein [Shewanella schlegeliana]|uniref:Glycosyltransferase family 2 protein n=1 Tax=Shewanella schlegeliana TaxID=190308 RepID=A0ABS1T1L2_9GAMM|nr:glycosyltransferase family 2 protein [Shewanella schlegeliana]MBL4914677.1 glycosyltransferase family 2 protein [Shewanella schlegeliana]MCL1109991.1 glycosyltransferase family 2 protein [Shewanella schlegeliana]GIU25326.1 dolichol-phosphate mannosyltransferase [Shewanella schlegeliana]
MISVVIPAKDEQANIGPLVEEIHRALKDKTPFEVIVVDDGSNDDTFGELLRTGERLGCSTKAIRHEKSTGQSTALHTGVQHASGDIIATLDADGQNDPADIPAMLDLIPTMTHNDFCIAGYRKNRKDTAWKRFQSRVANKVRDGLLGDGVPDTGCGLKVFPKASFLKLPYFDHMHRYIPALIRRHGGEVKVSIVNHRDRMEGESKYTAWNRVWVGIVDILGVMWLNRRTRLPNVVKTETTQAQ